MRRFSTKTRLRIPASTKVYLLSRPYRLTIELTSARLTRRQRKQLLQAYLRLIEPQLERLTYGYISHSNICYGMDHERSDLKMRESLGLETLVEQLGFRIRMSRLARKLSQKAVAKAAGISHSHLSRLEHGRNMPNHATLLALSKVLEVPLVTLSNPI